MVLRTVKKNSDICLLNKETFKSKLDAKEDKKQVVSEEEFIKAKKIVESFVNQKYSTL